jgi:hypothetical protein
MTGCLRVLAGSLLVALVVACGGGDSRSGASAQGTAPATSGTAVAAEARTPTASGTAAATGSPTASRTPTRTPTASASATPTRTPTPAAPAAATGTAGAAARGVDLTKALLTLDDLPPGWTTPSPSPDSSAFCNQDITIRPTARADADFERGQSFVFHGLGAYNRGEAAAAMDQERKTLANCTQWTETDSDGTTTTYRVRPLSFPKLGDETLAFRLSAEAAGAVAEVDGVFIRRGDVISRVGNGQVGVRVAVVDSALTEQLARKANAKLAAAAGAGSPTAWASGSGPLAAGFAVHADPTYGFCLAHPETWTLRTDLPDPLRAVVGSPDRSAAVTVAAGPLRPTDTLEAQAEEVLRGARSTGREVSVLESGPATLAGLPARRLVLRGPNAAGVLQQVTVVLTAKGATGYHLSFTAPPDVEPRWTADFQRMVEMFRIR